MDYKEKIMTEDIHTSQGVEKAVEHVIEYPRPQTQDKQDETDQDNRIKSEEDYLSAPYGGLKIPLETYWSEYYGQTEHTYEWNNGILEAKPSAKLIQAKTYLWFLGLVNDYLSENSIAEMTLWKTAFQFNNILGQTKVRIPDLSVVLNDNPIPIGLHDRSYKGIFDICVESISDSKRSEVERDTIIKREEYAQAGVKEYYILDEKYPIDRKCETAFYRLSSSGVYQPIRSINGVIQSTVLPGFQFRVDHLEARPTPLEMLDEPDYRGYTSPLLRAERERAERAEQRLQAALELQAEQKRSIQESQTKLKQLIAYANAQGISLPDDLLELGQ